MAIELALRLKGQDLNFQAAKAGAEFSQLLSEGNRDEAEAKLSEARVLFDQAGELELLQAAVLNRLSALGGDIPIERFNTVVGVTEKTLTTKSTVIPSLTESQTGHLPSVTETQVLQETVEPLIKSKVSEQTEQIFPLSGGELLQDEINKVNQAIAAPSPIVQSDALIDTEEVGVSESPEEKFEPPTIKVNEESREIIIESKGETTILPFKKNKRGIQFKLLAYLAERPGVEIPRQTLDEFLKMNRSDTSVGITMYALRKKLGDAEGKILETIGTSRNVSYRLNATIEPWGADTSLESQDVRNDTADEVSKDIFTGSDSIIETEIAEVVEVASAEGTGNQQEQIQKLTSNSEIEAAISHELTSSETYALAQLLSNEDRNALSTHGITIGLEDRPQIREIAEKFASQIEDLENSIQSKQKDALLHKLLEYVGNKEEVFMANLANEDALFLLAFMAGVTSEDSMRDLLGYESDVKKNG